MFNACLMTFASKGANVQMRKMKSHHKMFHIIGYLILCVILKLCKPLTLHIKPLTNICFINEPNVSCYWGICLFTAPAVSNLQTSISGTLWAHNCGSLAVLFFVVWSGTQQYPRGLRVIQLGFIVWHAASVQPSIGAVSPGGGANVGM